MNNKEHLTLDGLQKILCIKGSLNLGLSYEIEIKTNFPNISPIERPLMVDHKIIDPNWLAGFSSGFEEGCFLLTQTPTPTPTPPPEVTLLLPLRSRTKGIPAYEVPSRRLLFVEQGREGSLGRDLHRPVLRALAVGRDSVPT